MAQEGRINDPTGARGNGTREKTFMGLASKAFNRVVEPIVPGGRGKYLWCPNGPRPCASDSVPFFGGES